MKRSCFIPLVLFLAACVPAARPQTLTAADRVAIYNAIAHYHFDPANKIVEGKLWPVIFVSPRLTASADWAYEGDPTPPELLPLLRDLSPRIESAAKADVVIQTKRGNILREDGIWIGFGTAQPDGGEVRVRMESFLNGTNAVGYEYRLARQGDRWVVVKATLLWIA